MNFSLTFDNSGDSIDFVSTNPGLVEYYVDQLNQRKANSFRVQNSTWADSVTQDINHLHTVLEEVNSWIEELTNWRYDVFELEDYLNQKNLNKLHANWVNSQNQMYDIDVKRQQNNFTGIVEHIHDLFPDDERFVMLGNLLTKLNQSQQYDQINHAVHKLESKFDQINFRMSDGSWQEFSNIFDKSVLTNDVTNFNLTFNHLGRTLYNKFQTFDLNLEHDDENSFDQLLGFVDIRLVPTQTIPLSREYQQWCRSVNRVACGDNLNLGNIPNLSNRLTEYRQLIYKNLKNNNNFSIHLT
jgi:chaperonin cofactor prefoldin